MAKKTTMEAVRLGQHPRTAQILRDIEAAKQYFINDKVRLSSYGRIQWRHSNIFTAMVDAQLGKCHWCRRVLNAADYATVTSKDRMGTNRVAGPDYPTLEHIVSLENGGRDHPSNIRIAHNRCNNERVGGGSNTAFRRSATLLAAYANKHQSA